MDRSLIERYAAGATVLASSIEGLTDDDLNAFPVPGTWSIRQIVVHMLDSDLVGADRMKRVIAEDVPILLVYDETKFINRLHPEKTDLNVACEIFRLNRLHMANILRQLADEDFQRVGVHSERGPESLAHIVEIYVNHLDHHMKFLREKRQILGKP